MSQASHLGALRDALRLDELYRTTERAQGDARTSAIVEIVAIRERIKRAITSAESSATLGDRIAGGMIRQGGTEHDQASGLRRMLAGACVE